MQDWVGEVVLALWEGHTLSAPNISDGLSASRVARMGVHLKRCARRPICAGGCASRTWRHL